MLTKPGDCQPAGRRYHLTMSPREWATWTPAGILRYEERTDKSASFLEYIPFNLTFEYEHKRSLHKASIALFAHSIREHSLNWQLYTRSFDLRSDGHSNPTLPFAPEEAAKLTGVRPKSLSIALTIQPPKSWFRFHFFNLDASKLHYGGVGKWKPMWEPERHTRSPLSLPPTAAQQVDKR